MKALIQMFMDRELDPKSLLTQRRQAAAAKTSCSRAPVPASPRIVTSRVEGTRKEGRENPGKVRGEKRVARSTFLGKCLEVSGRRQDISSKASVGRDGGTSGEESKKGRREEEDKGGGRR